MKLNNSIWFFDIDDTLIDTAGTSSQAVLGIERVFSDAKGDEIGKKVAEEFSIIFDQMLTGYRIKNENEWENSTVSKETYRMLISNIEQVQAEVLKNWGASKKWSREVFIKMAADRVGIDVTPELVHEAADAYWMTLTEKTKFFDGVKPLFKKLTDLNRPVFLITSSDGRLKMNENGNFEYDPKYSEALKRQRIELLREKGLHFNLVTIGDPEDKPHISFFMKGVKNAQEVIGDFNFENCVMVGDSYGGDLQTPREEMGFGYVILFEKNRTETKLEENNLIKTGNLVETLRFFK